MRNSFIISAICLVSVYAAKLPSFIKPCSISSPKLDECIATAIRTGGSLLARGIPDLGIPAIDPVKLDTIIINSPTLKITFTEPVLTGLADFKLMDVHINSDRSKLHLNYTVNVTVNAHYVMDGQVLILPIKGDGEARIKLQNMNTVIKFDLKVVDNYWTIPTYKKSYTVGHAHFKFTNLFGGNKELADITLKFVNENWSDILNEIAPPAIYQGIEHCVENVKMLLSAVPADELILE